MAQVFLLLKNRRFSSPIIQVKTHIRQDTIRETLLPEIAEKWDYKRNTPLMPYDVTVGSGKKVYWVDRKRPISICDRTKNKR